MKKRIVLSIGIIVAFFFTACNNDQEIPDAPNNKEGAVTFTLSGMSKQMATYAEVPANQGENDLDNLEIYMFKKEDNMAGKLESVFRFGDGNEAFGGTSDNPTATIDLTGRTGEKNMYFIANGEGNVAGIADVMVGVTTEADFIEFISEKQAALLQTPLLMSSVTSIDLDAPLDTNDKTITLKRRVARFDVSNVSTDTNFEIQKIYITETNLRAHIFEPATGVATTIETGNLSTIDFTTKTGANAGDVESVFYLYPTTLGEGKTNISFEGKFMNEAETKIYKINPSPEVFIAPNNRYMLKAKSIKENEVEFTIVIDDWTNGTTEEVKPKDNLLEFSEGSLIGDENITVTGGNTYDITNATKPSTLTVHVKSSIKGSVSARIFYLYGTDNALPGLEINDPDPIMTYASQYIQDYKITIPPQTVKVPLNAVVEIINNNHPENRKTIYINSMPNYHTTTLKPVRLGDIYWAPVNVGVEGSAATVEDKGKLYQWGRNYGSTYGTTGDTYGTGDPVTKEVANGIAKDKFILIKKYPYDWLTTQDTTLWEKAQGPCPSGWRIPSQQELTKIATAFNDGKVTFTDNKATKIEGDRQGEFLFCPRTGYRVYYSGTYGNPTNTYFWSYNYYSEGNIYYTSYIDGINNVCGNSIHNAGHGFSVRCIQE